MKRHTLIAVAGLIWFGVGLALLTKGISLILFTGKLAGQQKGPLLSAFMYLFTGGLIPATLLLIFLGLIFGGLKGRFILAKTAARTVKRVSSFTGYTKITKLYRLHDFLLILGMIGLGRLMRWVHLPSDIHGLIDVAIGSALVNGALIYFRYSLKMKQETTP